VWDVEASSGITCKLQPTAPKLLQLLKSSTLGSKCLACSVRATVVTQQEEDDQQHLQIYIANSEIVIIFVHTLLGTSRLKRVI